MAKAVCNASPIIGLSIIGKVELLWEIFDEVFIPEEVYNEVVGNNEYKNYGENELKEALKNDKKSIGLIGILITAKKLGLISEIKKYLDILIQEGYRISKKLYLEGLKSAGEEVLFK